MSFTFGWEIFAYSLSAHCTAKDRLRGILRVESHYNHWNNYTTQVVKCSVQIYQKNNSLPTHSAACLRFPSSSLSHVLCTHNSPLLVELSANTTAAASALLSLLRKSSQKLYSWSAENS